MPYILVANGEWKWYNQIYKSEISFEEAWKASGLNSNTDDYFPIEEAVLVELRTE